MLLTLVLVFATGLGAVATGSPRGRWVVIAHGVAAIVVVLLIPWKSMVVRHGLRRARRSRWASLLLALLVVAALTAGFVSSTGAARSVGGLPVMWLHIAVALALVPLLLWHIFARSTRPRRTDLSRRNAMRFGLLAALAAGAYAATEITIRLVGAPGARRRFTGSYETGSFEPARMPVTSWLDDRVPAIDAATWRLVVVDVSRATRADTRRTVQHQTYRSGRRWTAPRGGTPSRTGPVFRVASLVRPDETARSLYVHSVTGYWMRLPIDDLDGLVLATKVGGRPLRRGTATRCGSSPRVGAASGGSSGSIGSRSTRRPPGGSRRSR